MNKEQRRAIRKFETWQQKKFARNAKQGYRFFQPDRFEQPTPRSSRDAWGGTYVNEDHDRRQEKYTTWAMYAFVFAYIVFLIWRELP
jgi:hypothetical protein